MSKDWNADDWHLFICQHCDNRATSPHGMNQVALKIADTMDELRHPAQSPRCACGNRPECDHSCMPDVIDGICSHCGNPLAIPTLAQASMMPISQDAATIAQTAHVIINRLTEENEALKHDLERHIEIASNEINGCAQAQRAIDFCEWLQGYFNGDLGRDDLTTFEANQIRNELNEKVFPPTPPIPSAPAQASSETVAWAIMHVNCAGIWKITEDKDSADYWERSGFPVRALAYSVPSAHCEAGK